MTVLVASDLDGTLIYSSRSARFAAGDRPPMVCVERIDGAPAACMTAVAASRLTALAERTTFVPVTTRAPKQFARVTMPGASRYAVSANGGVLYVDGEIEPAWSRTVGARLANGRRFVEVWEHVARVCRPEWTTKLRNVDTLFCYAVVTRDQVPAEFVAEQAAWASACGWRTSLQGRKLYWVPQLLTKAAAVAEIARRVDARTVLAAGDSLLDVDLLEHADLGIHPSHGELADTGWSAPHVVRTSAVGARAGQEIVDWFVDHDAYAAGLSR